MTSSPTASPPPAAIAIGLLPEGGLYLGETSIDAKGEELRAAFAEGNGPGLLTLAQSPELRSCSPTVRYWLEVAEDFMRQTAATLDLTHEDSHAPGPTESEAKSWTWRAPPMEGGEYLTPAVFQSIWCDMQTHWTSVLAQSGLSPRRCLEVLFPRWADVGRVCFHLAEHRASAEYPFMFVATYTTRTTDKARVQHRPLGLALKDSLATGRKEVIAGLLRPIERAAKDSVFLQDALTSRKIFQPQHLTPRETHQVLSDLRIFKEAGIVCKVPDFWKQGRPPRAKMRITIGARPPQNAETNLGLEGLVDFDATVAIGDREVSREELQRLLSGNSPLVQLNGQWVHVDPDKLKPLIDRWDQATALAGAEGMPLGEALRLLAGFGTKGTGAAEEDQFFRCDDDEESDVDVDGDGSPEHWADVVCGPELAATLDRLRSPGHDLPPHICAILERDIRATLRPYQRAGVAWLHLLSTLGLGGCLADDMGLGKTLQIICLLVIRKHEALSRMGERAPAQHHPAHAPTLLVVPASLIGNWLSEIEKFAPSLSTTVLHPTFGHGIGNISGLNKAAGEKSLTAADLCITTYGMLHRNHWIKDIEWGCVIADEAQAIKNADTRQSQAARGLKARVRFALTGTPVENHLGDLWTIFDFACPKLLGPQNKFCATVKLLEGRRDNGETYAALRRLINPYLLRRSKTDKSVIADLPDKIEVRAVCDLSIRQAKLYQKHVEFLDAALKNAADVGGSAIDRRGLVLSSLMKLKQICNHPSQFENDNQYLPSDSGKFDKLRELVETIASRQESLLVFTQFREITDVLQHFLSGLFRRQGLVLHGGTPISSRKEMVDDFQRPGGPPFFILSLRAGGTGLNLTRAQHVIHFDRWWNPAVENQATDRAFRIGQKNNVMVHKFVCRGTLEEKIDKMIESKKSLADSLVGGSSEVSLTELSNDELLAVVRLDIDTLWE